jgi:predicted Zn-ribbon and HTH transcriptional regulator
LMGSTKSRPKPPSIPADRHDTLRHEIITLLSAESLTAREISERLGIQEKEVLEHLEHVRIALHGGLVMIPALCMACGFSFRKRERLKGPGRCPVCRSEHLAEPRFSIG